MGWRGREEAGGDLQPSFQRARGHLMENTPRILLAKRGLSAPNYVETCDLRSGGALTVSQCRRLVTHSQRPLGLVTGNINYRAEIVGLKKNKTGFWPHNSTSSSLVWRLVIGDKSWSLFPEANTVNYGMTVRSRQRAPVILWSHPKCFFGILPF